MGKQSGEADGGTLDDAVEAGLDAAEAAAGEGEEGGAEGEAGDGEGTGAEGGEAEGGEAGEGEGEGSGDGQEGDGEGDGAEGDEDPGEEGIAEGEVEGLSEKGREKINRKIGKNVRRRHEAEEAQQAAEQKAGDAETRATKAEQALESKVLDSTFAMGLTPDYVSTDEAQLLERADRLQEDRTWLLEHFDGYEGSGTAEDPNYSAAQIRAQYGKVDRALASIGPRAQTLREERVKLMLADAKAGRTLREKGVKLEDALRKGPAPRKAAGGKKTLRKPPAVPGQDGSRTRKPPVSAGKAGSGFDAKAVMENPSPDALEKAFEKLDI